MLGQIIPFGKESKVKDPQRQWEVTNVRPMVWRCSLAEDKGTGTQNRETVMGMKGYTWMKLGKRYQA